MWENVHEHFGFVESLQTFVGLNASARKLSYRAASYPECSRLRTPHVFNTSPNPCLGLSFPRVSATLNVETVNALCRTLSYQPTAHVDSRLWYGKERPCYFDEDNFVSNLDGKFPLASTLLACASYHYYLTGAGLLFFSQSFIAHRHISTANWCREGVEHLKNTARTPIKAVIFCILYIVSFVYIY